MLKANSKRNNNYAKRGKDGKKNFVLPRFLIVRSQCLLSGLLIKVRASTSGGPGFRFIVFLSALLATGHTIMRQRAGHLYFYFTLLLVVTYSLESRVLGSSPVRTGDSLTSGKGERSGEGVGGASDLPC